MRTPLSSVNTIALRRYGLRPGLLLAGLCLSSATCLSIIGTAAANPGENHTLSLMIKSFGYEPPAFVLEEAAPRSDIDVLEQPLALDPAQAAEAVDAGASSLMEAIASSAGNEDGNGLSTLIDTLSVSSLLLDANDQSEPQNVNVSQALVPVDAEILQAVLGETFQAVTPNLADEAASEAAIEPDTDMQLSSAATRPEIEATIEAGANVQATAEIPLMELVPLPSPRPAITSMAQDLDVKKPADAIEVLSAEEALRRLEAEGADLQGVQTLAPDEGQALYDQLRSQNGLTSTRSSSN